MQHLVLLAPFHVLLASFHVLVAPFPALLASPCTAGTRLAERAPLFTPCAACDVVRVGSVFGGPKGFSEFHEVEAPRSGRNWNGCLQ